MALIEPTFSSKVQALVQARYEDAGSESRRGSSLGGRFQEALLASRELAIIAEIKRRSPSRGDLNAGLDPAEMAVAYQKGGAACLSVLTDEVRFGGCADDLTAAAKASSLPILRKDFITSVEDVHESHTMGADALLLIVADLDGGLLAELHELALSLGIDVVTEVKSPSELESALEAGAYMIGVNQRSQPKSPKYTMDYNRAIRFAEMLPNDVVKIAASGIGVPGGTEVSDLYRVGYDAALIGEALVTADDPVGRLRELTTRQPQPA